jgi:hypothetical protein
MHPLFRRIWIVSVVFSSVIDLPITYWLYRRGGQEINLIPAGLIAFFGPEIGILVMGTLVTALLTSSMLWLADKTWKQNGPLVSHIVGYESFIALAAGKLLAAAWVTRRILFDLAIV